MTNKEILISALSTLFYGVTLDVNAINFNDSSVIVPSGTRGCNILLDWYEKSFGVNFGIRFEEDGTNFDNVINTITNS